MSIIVRGVVLILFFSCSSPCPVSFKDLTDEQHLYGQMTQFSCHSNSYHVDAHRNTHYFWSVCMGIIKLDYLIMLSTVLVFQTFILQRIFTFQDFIQRSFPLCHMMSADARSQQLAH